MSNTVAFQDPGEGIFEAEVLEVKVSKGDSVREGQELLVVETDKAAFEVAAPRSGVIRDVSVASGDTVQVGQQLLTFEADDGGDEDAGDDAGSDENDEAQAAERDEPEANA
jgi:pyruvate dehydrogenase E2 component (dihydrolipoamide acetyltransferase)